MKWPIVKPAGTLARGTFNTPGSVQAMASSVRGEIAQGSFNLFPKENKTSGNRGLRTQPLGSFQSGDKVLGKQNYDVRFNAHVCKALILSWGRNAYSSDEDKGRPLEVSRDGQTLIVFCHIDITTPRDNMLWHHIEGPHVVIERYKVKNDPNPKRTYKAKSPVFELTPNDVFMLYVWERDHNQGKSMAAADRSWPQWLQDRQLRLGA